MNQYFEDMIKTGLAKPMKIKGSPLGVFWMTKIFAEYKLYPPILKSYFLMRPELLN